MFAIIFLALVAATAAAPHWSDHDRDHFSPRWSDHHHSPPRWPHHDQHPRYSPYATGPDHFDPFNPFAGDFFDARSFWAGLAKEMKQVDEMLSTLNERFPTASCDTKIEGNEYKITIPLSGFQEKDIVVKAKEGFLMVQAVHKMAEGGETIYIDAKTLPANVNVTGTWTFDQGVLKIVFPLKAGVEGSVEVTQKPVEDETQRPFKDREEMDDDSAETGDVDVGLRGDLDKTNALFTNEISRNPVEATTYSVDLKDEVEFVPVRHNK